MGKLLKYTQFINESSNTSISIGEFIDSINHDGMLGKNKQSAIDWWDTNRGGVNINLFEFNSPHPIVGCAISLDTVAMNMNMVGRMPSEIILFILIHESKHLDQASNSEFDDGYFQTIVNGDTDGFVEYYMKSEKEANQYAENAMNVIGFNGTMAKYQLNRNEDIGAAAETYSMMKKDIEATNATSLFDLIKSQIY
jgi:hypothetical protein